MIKIQYILLIILVVVLAILYRVVKQERHHRHHEHKHRASQRARISAASARAAAMKDPCDFMQDQGYSKGFVTNCKTYLQTCGMASTANEVLELSESFDPQDNRAEDSMKSDLIRARLDHSSCTAPMACSHSGDCPSEFKLECQNGMCV